MRYPTYGELRQRIQKELEIEDGKFISSSELLSYFNQAVDDAEQTIHTLFEDYFLTSAALPLVAGQSEYALPDDIYASKIRSVIYTKGTTSYEIERIRDMRKFKEIALEQVSPSTDGYRYILKNPSGADGIKLVLYPAARETDSAAVTIWYLRNATRAESDSSVCDIPEFSSYVVQFVKVMVMTKEMHPGLPLAIQTLEYFRKQMIETLSEMVPDGANKIEMDLTLYEEMT